MRDAVDKSELMERIENDLEFLGEALEAYLDVLARESNRLKEALEEMLS